MNPQFNRPRPRRSRVTVGNATTIAVIAVIVLAVLGTCTAYAKTKTQEVVVTGKERVCSGSRNSGDCKYLVFTDKTTFRITDYIGRMTSSDAYGRIVPCHRYRLDTYGFRFGFTSSYPNIKQATDLGPVEGCTPNR